VGEIFFTIDTPSMVSELSEKSFFYYSGCLFCHKICFFPNDGHFSICSFFYIFSLSEICSVPKSVAKVFRWNRQTSMVCRFFHGEHDVEIRF
jgi:hypothetical protein